MERCDVGQDRQEMVGNVRKCKEMYEDVGEGLILDRKCRKCKEMKGNIWKCKEM